MELRKFTINAALVALCFLAAFCCGLTAAVCIYG
jgi:hypothetical protein